MQLLIQTAGYKISDKFRSVVRDRLLRLEGIFGPFYSGKVIIRKVNDTVSQICIEALIYIPGNEIHASGVALQSESALNELTDHLKSQLSRHRRSRRVIL